MKRARTQPRKPRPPVEPLQVQHYLSAEEITELVAAYQDGASLQALARQFNAHAQTVMAHLARNGVERRPNGQKLFGERLEEARRLRREGWSLNDLAAKFDVSYDTMRRAMLKQPE